MIVNTNVGMTKNEYQGLSTDTKPLLDAEHTGSTFFVIDTGVTYVWHIDAWYCKL